MKQKKHIGVILSITTICLIFIKILLGNEIVLTRLDITYLYMLIFLCIKSFVEERSD